MLSPEMDAITDIYCAGATEQELSNLFGLDPALIRAVVRGVLSLKDNMLPLEAGVQNLNHQARR